MACSSKTNKQTNKQNKNQNKNIKQTNKKLPLKQQLDLELLLDKVHTNSLLFSKFHLSFRQAKQEYSKLLIVPLNSKISPRMLHRLWFFLFVEINLILLITAAIFSQAGNQHGRFCHLLSMSISAIHTGVLG